MCDSPLPPLHTCALSLSRSLAGCVPTPPTEECKHGELMAPKKAKAKKKSTGDDKGDKKVGDGGVESKGDVR